MKNFKEALGNLQIGQVIFVHDFFQKLLLINQDKVSSAHWNHEQVTRHPTVCFYVCEKCGKVVKEELIHISEDKHHNVAAVAVFQNKSIGHIHSKGIKVEDIIEFIYQMVSQYKGRTAFYLLSKMKVPLCQYFFGVKHGKGPSDRAGAHYKNFISKVVKAWKINFSTCAELVSFSQEKYDFEIKCDEVQHENNRIHQERKKIQCIA